MEATSAGQPAGIAAVEMQKKFNAVKQCGPNASQSFQERQGCGGVLQPPGGVRTPDPQADTVKNSTVSANQDSTCHKP